MQLIAPKRSSQAHAINTKPNSIPFHSIFVNINQSWLGFLLEFKAVCSRVSVKQTKLASTQNACNMTKEFKNPKIFHI
jgi:hypothetical protein